MSIKEVRVRILVEGRLHGTNFRYQTQQQARKLGLVGFVRNLSDGRIEIEVQGRKDKVSQILEWCQQEPQSVHIKNILFRYDDPLERHAEFVVR
jgi:acylphosphatase